eukprot:CAMPEP_0115608242 /NCGR_PEP_ID=MMETSP0272-20121206/18909_1 /TAXON_ID=71861 /ORGANISM="Scrippsiella trochoidea, Strain CCMP3099" /LENGTH=59 /DNA_ID=CAMNT_0003043923 /DNA_START=63 /DNA_END=238 /DNA_ORIENTATION=+
MPGFAPRVWFATWTIQGFLAAPELACARRPSRCPTLTSPATAPRSDLRWSSSVRARRAP